MLQIIGWLVCLCLFVKGLELADRAGARKDQSFSLAEIGAGIDILGALVFAYFFYAQGQQTANALSSSAVVLAVENPRVRHKRLARPRA